MHNRTHPTPDGPIRFVDTTIRDGQMSLWATRMTTNQILPMAGSLEGARFAGMEVMGTAFFKKLIRELRENPFERIRRIKELAPTTPLRMIHSRHTAAFQVTPADIYRLWAERIHAAGIDEVRMSDPSNTVATWEKNKAMAEAAGLRVVINLTYSSSPKHTDAYYREKARAAAALRPAGICIKDPGGLLTPDATRTLVPVVQAEIDDIPLEFHGHCSNGLGLLNALEAVGLGIRTVNTAIPPLADAASLPSAPTLARNLRARGYTVDVDDAEIAAVSEYLERLRALHDLPAGRTAEFDETYYQHQVPGGMASNLRFQLGKLGMADRLDEVLDEVARVREDLGYPIMVTPYSQFVGTQATLNVVTGQRYSQVVDEVARYAAGYWGQEEADGVAPDVKDVLLSRRRPDQQSDVDPDAVTVADLRRQLDATDVDDDEFLLRFFSNEADVAAMHAADGQLISPAGVQQPWVALMERLSRNPSITRAEIRKGGTSLTLSR
jgi:oxaloacetate decarboxylase alpha subunit